MLNWASPFNICCFLDNHEYGLPAHSIECILAAGAIDSLRAPAGDAIQQLRDFAAKKKDWLFGHFGYGLAKETEPGPSHPTPHPPREDRSAGEGSFRPDPIGFPDLFFFVPEILIELSAGSIRIGSFGTDHAAILAQIEQTAPDIRTVPGGAGIATSDPQITATSPKIATADPQTPAPLPAPALQPRFSREEYLSTVRRLQEHILRGDCYEINFCQEFYAQGARIDPLQTWHSLSRISPNPFAAYYRVGDSYLLCSSPERYLKRTGNTLLSQPIKGTWPRSATGRGEDEKGREALLHSVKDRSENVMVVDLVRNDLSRICLEGSVRVKELYGIYTFPQVHQMISSVEGELGPDKDLADCIRATFPMGSMTGAPKNRVVQLIGQYERSPRGLFSGAVGYVRPGGDFDLNVVIRSILYNQATGYLSCQVGSAITFYSDPAGEYEECLLKAEGMKKALGI